MHTQQAAAMGILSLQNSSTIIRAVISNRTESASGKKKSHPAINLKASSTNLPACRIKPPGIGY